METEATFRVEKDAKTISVLKTNPETGEDEVVWVANHDGEGTASLKAAEQDAETVLTTQKRKEGLSPADRLLHSFGREGIEEDSFSGFQWEIEGLQDEFWVVERPDEKSEMGDTLYKSSFVRFAAMVIGASMAKTPILRKIYGIYKDQVQATEIAKKLLQKRDDMVSNGEFLHKDDFVYGKV
jgi:hypothetical protein